MPIDPNRLLGFAFATADLFVEISAEGAIAYAMGASEALSGAEATELVGRPWRDFIGRGDQPLVEALFDGLEIGLRAGPVVVELAAVPADTAPRAVSLSAFRSPGNNGAISCALSGAAVPRAPPPGEMYDRMGFEAHATALIGDAETSGAELELAFLELGGLEALRKAATPEQRLALEARLNGVLRAHAVGGSAATELGDERFALVRQRGESRDTLVRRISRLLDSGGKANITPTADIMSLGGGGDPRQTLRALRFALDGFLRDGGGDAAPADLPEALSRSMARTLDDAGELGRAIRDRDFRLVYQPVVLLKTGALHHYEALVRFGDAQSPFPTIRMAEEMDLIESLDRAILERAMETLAATPGLKLAVNVSGRTIASADFIAHACELIGGRPGVRGRLMIELTESAAIEDLAVADRHLHALREQGCEICLDDFGAGAASLAYLQQLRLDVLKIDGRYIRDLQHGGREAVFVKHLVKMCGELKVRTLAEMVESSVAEDAVRRAGVEMAQGWLYGAASDTPAPALTRIDARMRPALAR